MDLEHIMYLKVRRIGLSRLTTVDYAKCEDGRTLILSWSSSGMGTFSGRRENGAS